MIAKIKSNVSMRDVCERYGITTKIKKRAMVKCMFHDDSHPSLSIDFEKNRFRCFGCGEAGDVIDLVSKRFNLSMKEAMIMLMHDFSMEKDVDPWFIHMQKRAIATNKVKEELIATENQMKESIRSEEDLESEEVLKIVDRMTKLMQLLEELKHDSPAVQKRALADCELICS